MLGVSARRSIILAVTVLMCEAVTGAGSVTKTTTNVNLFSSESQTISTSGFPKAPSNRSFTHVWSIRAPLYVQVTFTDYDLSKNSYIKIIDGKPSIENPPKTFIFNSNQIPVFQSRSRFLYILLKSSPRGKHEFYRGVRAKLEAVTMDRDNWYSNDVPSTGYCGSINQEDSTESFVFQPPSKVLNKHLFDCVWNIRAKFLQVTHIKLKGSSRSSGDTLPFSVHSRGYSGSPADYVYNEIGPYTSQLLTSKNMTFYVRLHSHMQQGDSVVVQFSNKSYEIGMLKNVNTTKLDACPFKTDSNYVNRCYLYWENPSLDDETCSALSSAVYCKGAKGSFRHCYSRKYDMCDGFDDCPRGDDEVGCDESDNGFNIMGILKFAGLLAIPAALYYLLRNQRYKKVFSGLCSLFKSGSTSPPDAEVRASRSSALDPDLAITTVPLAVSIEDISPQMGPTASSLTLDTVSSVSPPPPYVDHSNFATVSSREESRNIDQEGPTAPLQPIAPVSPPPSYFDAIRFPNNK